MNAKKLRIMVAFISILNYAPIYAKDLGVIGETYPIKETDFLEFLQSQAKNAENNGKLNQLQTQMQLNATAYRDRPKRVSNLDPTQTSKSWLFDPSIVLDHDITTVDGKIIARAGTKINPLEKVPLTKTLIFYDAEIPAEVKWALELDKKLKGCNKLILVNGSVLSEEKRFKKAIYFDQEGRLVKQFGIKHHPAYLVQQEQKLKITEVRV